MKNNIVTRIAPSPTGYLHVGTARGALYNFLYARKHGGTFILRIEDTDKERSKKEYEDLIVDGLSWLGIEHDEFVRQSDNIDTHKEYIAKLIDEKKAYISKEQKKDDPSVEVELVRFRNPNQVVQFTDLIKGDISVDTTDLGDFVIARGLDDPLHHLAVVVDDHTGGVTHAIRGDDLLSNTPRQILIYEALGMTPPQYAHIPMILSEDKKKLSKRRGAKSIPSSSNAFLILNLTSCCKSINSA